MPGRSFFVGEEAIRFPSGSYLVAVRSNPSFVATARQLEKPVRFRRNRRKGAATTRQPGKNRANSPRRPMARLKSAR